MQEGRKCIFVILQERQFCAQISFVFHCFWCLLCSVKIKKYFELRPALWLKMCHFTCTFNICKNSISPEMSLTTFLHSHDDMKCNRRYSRHGSRNGFDILSWRFWQLLLATLKKWMNHKLRCGFYFLLSNISKKCVFYFWTFQKCTFYF